MLTYAEQRARARAATVTEHDDLLRVEQRLRRRVKAERLALLTKALAERVRTAVDGLLHRVCEPIVACRHDGVVRERPVDGVVEEETIGILAGDSGLVDELGEWTCTCLSIETGLRDAGVLRSNDLRRYQRESRTLLRRRGTDDAMEPL